MKTVLITGAGGFIGKNLCAQLELEDNVQILRYTRKSTVEDLTNYLLKADFIFHLAGVNRPCEVIDYSKDNFKFTEKIIKILEDNQRKTPILLTSSTQAELDNPYGESKRSAEESLFKYARSTGAEAYIYRLPSVFGKWCRPNYNSVVATFCFNIANNVEITLNDSTKILKLAYIDDVIADFTDTMHTIPKISKGEFCSIERTFDIQLRVVAEKLYAFRDSRINLTMPDLSDPIDKFLYASYISYYRTDDFSYNLDVKRDSRGWLAEFIKSKYFGQIFVSRTGPGITRGNHWHHTKIEKFLVIDGDAEVKFRDLNSSAVISYKVSGDELKIIDIPVGYIHSITNVGNNDLLTIFWADEIFNSQKPDTHYEEVECIN